ncbi:hypothetical protein [Pseudomonas rhodesiae]|uniref:hypothetical protein n=1 Tax=Pseudomonas rhodesiae TaxID=76760 RepID=UPI00209E01E3|nr:hypothetical protein [Pseudomonas rhodesiae]MCP1511024.1 hypothetical protein [Pseudomonas rhodesiae]MDF9769842.1 hypothetical protein [Pseudomonas rhodesiae]
MNYGLRVFGANGAIQMDTDSFTYQVMHNKLYKLGAQNDGLVITVQIPGFDPAKCSAVILPTQAATDTDCLNALPYQSVAAGVVTIRAKNPGETGTYLSTIQFRLLVTRFKN